MSERKLRAGLEWVDSLRRRTLPLEGQDLRFFQAWTLARLLLLHTDRPVTRRALLYEDTARYEAKALWLMFMETGASKDDVLRDLVPASREWVRKAFPRNPTTEREKALRELMEEFQRLHIAPSSREATSGELAAWRRISMAPCRAKGVCWDALFKEWTAETGLDPKTPAGATALGLHLIAGIIGDEGSFVLTPDGRVLWNCPKALDKAKDRLKTDRERGAKDRDRHKDVRTEMDGHDMADLLKALDSLAEAEGSAGRAALARWVQDVPRGAMAKKHGVTDDAIRGAEKRIRAALMKQLKQA